MASRLAKCRRCGAHGYWIFSGGQRSKQFCSTGQGLVAFVKGVKEGYADLDETFSALSRLETSKIEEKATAVLLKIAEEIGSSNLPRPGRELPFDCDPSLN
jgi:hypothetical protein